MKYTSDLFNPGKFVYVTVIDTSRPIGSRVIMRGVASEVIFNQIPGKATVYFSFGDRPSYVFGAPQEVLIRPVYNTPLALLFEDRRYE